VDVIADPATAVQRLAARLDGLVADLHRKTVCAPMQMRKPAQLGDTNNSSYRIEDRIHRPQPRRLPVLYNTTISFLQGKQTNNNIMHTASAAHLQASHPAQLQKLWIDTDVLRTALFWHTMLLAPMNSGAIAFRWKVYTRPASPIWHS
jgi:hypothetical protein